MTFSSRRFVNMVVKNDPSSHWRIEVALPKLPAKSVIKKVASSEAYLFVQQYSVISLKQKLC